jgi:hypothetical protein
MFAKIDPKKLIHPKVRLQVRMACNVMSQGGMQHKRLVLRIPAAIARELGPRIDIAVGLIGTPDEGILRITPGQAYSLWREKGRSHKERCFTVSVSVSRGLARVRSIPVKHQMDGDALLVVVPKELRPHYEDLVRRAKVCLSEDAEGQEVTNG